MKKRITGVLAAGLLLFGNEMASWLALLVLAALGLDLVFVGAPLSGAVFKPPPLGEVPAKQAEGAKPPLSGEVPPQWAEGSTPFQASLTIVPVLGRSGQKNIRLFPQYPHVPAGPSPRRTPPPVLPPRSFHFWDAFTITHSPLSVNPFLGRMQKVFSLLLLFWDGYDKV